MSNANAPTVPASVSRSAGGGGGGTVKPGPRPSSRKDPRAVGLGPARPGRGRPGFAECLRNRVRSSAPLPAPTPRLYR